MLFRHLKNLINVAHTTSDLRLMAINHEMAVVRDRRMAQDPKHLLPYGSKAYSQVDEDGILQEIFRRIGATNRRFVEFGVGDGRENNSLALLLAGWSGLWIEANPKSVATIRTGLPQTISRGRLAVVESFIDIDNINQLISGNSPTGEIDLLSVDIDGNDYHVLKAIHCVQPRVIAIEYNAKFPPPFEFCMPYNPTHAWQGDDYFGVSLKFLEVRLADRGYRLVGCCISGANAFFVRDDLVGDLFAAPYTAENHFEPSRYHYVHFRSGYKASLRAVDDWIARGAPA